MTTIDEMHIGRDARALAATQDASIQHGQPVAWAECRFGRTDGFSAVHRGGAPVAGTAVTLCGEVIPSPILRVPLTPRLIDSLGRCRYCENAYIERGAAA